MIHSHINTKKIFCLIKICNYWHSCQLRSVRFINTSFEISFKSYSVLLFISNVQYFFFVNMCNHKNFFIMFLLIFGSFLMLSKSFSINEMQEEIPGLSKISNDCYNFLKNNNKMYQITDIRARCNQYTQICRKHCKNVGLYNYCFIVGLACPCSLYIKDISIHLWN